MSQSIFGEFDGSVIIPDQPLDYAAGQRLRITVETALGQNHTDLLAEMPPDLEHRKDGAIVVRGLDFCQDHPEPVRRYFEQQQEAARQSATRHTRVCRGMNCSLAAVVPAMGNRHHGHDGILMMFQSI